MENRKSNRKANEESKVVTPYGDLRQTVARLSEIWPGGVDLFVFSGYVGEHRAHVLAIGDPSPGSSVEVLARASTPRGLAAEAYGMIRGLETASRVAKGG